MKNWLLGAVALASIAVALAGCGSSSPAKSGSKAASKAPIRLVYAAALSPAASLGGLSYPWGAEGAKAAAKAINAAGGVDGHKIVIDTCDTQGNPNQSVNCVLQAKKNGDIAFVGSVDQVGEVQMLSAMQQEKIPAVAQLGSTQQSLSSPMSFVIDPDSQASSFAVPSLWKREGCKNIAFFEVGNLAAGQLQDQLVTEAAHSFGAKITSIKVSIAQPSVSAQVSEAMSVKPDCASYMADIPTNEKLILGLREAGFKGKYMTVEGALLASALPSLGKAGNGVMATSMAYLPTETQPLTVKYRKEMTALIPNKKKLQANLNVFSQNAWSGVYLVKDALTGASQFTSAELVKKLSTLCSINVGSVYPGIGFCKPAVKSTRFPRLFNTETRYYVDHNGAYVPLDPGWHNFAGLVPSK